MINIDELFAYLEENKNKYPVDIQQGDFPRYILMYTKGGRFIAIYDATNKGYNLDGINSNFLDDPVVEDWGFSLIDDNDAFKYNYDLDTPEGFLNAFIDCVYTRLSQVEGTIGGIMDLIEIEIKRIKDGK